MFIKRHLVFLFVYCLFPISSTNQTSFCQKYKCDCQESPLNVKCSFNSSVKSIELLDASINQLDLSDNFLESSLVFGDTPLNLENLILRNNSITEIHENLFNKMPHLHYLDLSINKIERLQEIAFTSLNMLSYLNLSQSFSSDYKISRDICQLVNIKILDLSYSNLLEFDLECWKTPRLVELYLRNTLNVESSWQKWFQYIQNTIQVIDLSGSDVIILDSSLATAASNLNSLILSNLPKLDKNSLKSVLSTDRLFERLKKLAIVNINATQSNFPILNMFTISSNNNNSNNSLSLSELDISKNQYSYDFSTFLFNQRNLKNLKIFKANNNKFRACIENLRTESSYLSSLEYLDLSWNQIENSSCLFALKPLTKLQHLDMSHNQLSVSSADYLNLTYIFTNKLNLSNIDLSSNRLDKFVVYLSMNHTEINNFDLSSNNLRLFKFLSVSSVEQAQNLKNVQAPNSNSGGLKQDPDDDDDDDENDDQNDDDDGEDDVDILIENHHKEMNNEKLENDDDMRYMVINNLNLSSNQFQVIHINHMFQSIKNIQKLDMSSNPIIQVNGLSGDPQLIKEEVKNQTENSKLEALCIDLLDLSKCQVKRMPNLQHSCLNQIDLNRNSMTGSIHLVLSKYSVYFLDYLNLQSNNITFIKLIVSEQKFKQDAYFIQNSPFHYFFGSKNMINKDNVTSAHTLIDMRNNRNFKCDCYLSKLTISFQSLKLLSDCDEIYFDSARCFRQKQQQQTNTSNGLNLNTLNNKLRALFIVTFLLLIALSCLLVYYLCSDFVKTINLRSALDRFLIFCNLKRKFDSLTTNNSNVGVQYSKLINESASSHVELNSY
jgi:hypothetical protein